MSPTRTSMQTEGEWHAAEATANHSSLRNCNPSYQLPATLFLIPFDLNDYTRRVFRDSHSDPPTRLEYDGTRQERRTTIASEPLLIKWPLGCYTVMAYRIVACLLWTNVISYCRLEHTVESDKEFRKGRWLAYNPISQFILYIG
jgi:hypothetical protein